MNVKSESAWNHTVNIKFVFIQRSQTFFIFVKFFNILKFQFQRFFYIYEIHLEIWTESPGARATNQGEVGKCVL